MAYVFEHFDGGSLPAPWTVLTNGTGSITVSDSNVVGTTTTAAGSAAAIYKPFDRTRNQIVYHAWRSTAASPAARLWLIARPTAPVPETRAVLTTRQLLQITTYIGSGKRYIRLQHRNAAGINQNWKDAGQVWSTSASAISMPKATPLDDYAITGLEWDASGSRARLFALHVAEGTAFTLVSGPRLMALTDWVSFGAMQHGADPTLWLVIGWPETNAPAAGQWFTEYVAESWGARNDAWANQKANVGGRYNIKHHGGYDFHVANWLPQTRDNVALNYSGSGYDGYQVQWGSVMRDDDRTYVMTYSAKPTAAGKISIALATATSPDGPWTKFAGNPIIRQVNGTDRDQLTHSTLVKDGFEPDPAKRYKMICTGQDPATVGRVLLFTAPARTGPWTYRGVLIEGETAQSDAGYRGAPVWYGARWNLFYNTPVAGVGVARRAWGKRLDVGSISKEGISIYSNGDNSAQSDVTGVAGRLITLVSTAGFARDQLVVYDRDASANNYGLSRVRKVISATQLELYHSMPGATATGQLRTANRGAEALQRVFRLAEGWGWITTAFKVFTSHPTFQTHHETTAIRRSDALPGTPTIDWLATPLVLLGRWNNGVSEENMRHLSVPFHPASPLPRQRRDRSVLLRR